MLAIQVSIGALNDGFDADGDAVAKPRKPIPSGLVTVRQALAAGVVAGALGVALSALSGTGTALVAASGLGLGIAYDVRLSRTAWSWLPLALALPLLPVHAWLGAAGVVPDGLLPLVPTGMVAGAGLALANGLVDLERDARTGRPAVAVSLGAARAWWIHVALLAAVAVLAVFAAPTVGAATAAIGPGPAGRGSAGPALTSIVSIDGLRWLRTWAVVVGLAALGLGAAVLRVRRPAIRERGWELEAVGVASIGLGWLAGVAGSAGGLAR